VHEYLFLSLCWMDITNLFLLDCYIYFCISLHIQFVSILASFCVWTKSLICKVTANRDSTIQSEVRRISKFPVSCPDDVSSRLDAHLSAYSVRILHCIEKLLRQLASSGRLSVLERFTDSFQVPRKGRSINRPDDVVYRPDAYLRKARIAVQNEPSGHLTAVVRTLVHRIW
jgi:hypothetical protein